MPTLGDQELMLECQVLGDNGLGATGPSEPNEQGEKMQKQDQGGFHWGDHTVLDGLYKTANGNVFMLQTTIRQSHLILPLS